MTRAQLNKLTGSRAVPDLWHFAPGGTLGGNLAPSLYDQADELEAPWPQTCPGCGGPAGDAASGTCDDCLDGRAV